MSINFKAIATSTKEGVVSVSKKVYNGTPKGAVEVTVKGAKAVGHGTKVAVSNIPNVTKVRVSNPFHVAEDNADKA